MTLLYSVWDCHFSHHKLLLGIYSSNSTAVKPTKEKLKKIFATYGTPERLESDIGPPFNSWEFAMFASEEGFRHHCVTPLQYIHKQTVKLRTS